MKIAVAADHRGFLHKEFLKTMTRFSDILVTWVDLGAHTSDRTDYPLYAQKAVRAIQSKSADAAILLCGSGIGMAIAANRYSYIYAGVAWNPHVARAAKEDDNVNFLVIPSDFVSEKELQPIVESWLNARFKGGQYQERLKMVERKEQNSF